MDKLFEAYVAERLQQVARGVEIAIQGPVRTFAIDGSFQLRPDVVVITRGRPVLVLDTKWKLLERGLNDTDLVDLRQVYAYGTGVWRRPSRSRLFRHQRSPKPTSGVCR